MVQAKAAPNMIYFINIFIYIVVYKLGLMFSQ